MDLKDIWKGIDGEQFGKELPTSPAALDWVREQAQGTISQVSRLVKMFRRDLKFYSYFYLLGILYAVGGMVISPPSLQTVLLSLGTALVLGLPLLRLGPALRSLDLPEYHPDQPLRDRLAGYEQALGRLNSLRRVFFRQWLPVVWLVLMVRMGFYVVEVGKVVSQLMPFLDQPTLESYDQDFWLQAGASIYHAFGVGVLTLGLAGMYMFLRWVVRPNSFRIQQWRADLERQLKSLQTESAQLVPRQDRWEVLTRTWSKATERSDHYVVSFIVLALSCFIPNILLYPETGFPLYGVVAFLAAVGAFGLLARPQMRLLERLQRHTYLSAVDRIDGEALRHQIGRFLALRRIFFGGLIYMFSLLWTYGFGTLMLIHAEGNPAEDPWPQYQNLVGLALFIAVWQVVRSWKERRTNRILRTQLAEIEQEEGNHYDFEKKSPRL